MPNIFGDGRIYSILLIALLAIGQAIAAGAVAFATRDIFATFSLEVKSLPVTSLLMFAVAGIIIALLKIVERVIAENVGQNYVAALRSILFSHLSHLSPSSFANKRLGPLTIRFVGDLNAVRSWISAGIARSIALTIILPGAFIVLVLLNHQIATVVVLPIIGSLILIAIFAPGMDRLHRELRKRRGRLSADMTERIPIALQLKLLGRGEKEFNRLNQNSSLLRRAAVARVKRYSVLRAIPDIGISLSGCLLLAMALTTNATTGEAAAALAIIGIIAIPLRDVCGIWNRYAAWRIASEKCALILDIPKPKTPVPPRPNKQVLIAPASLEFKNVYKQNLKKINALASPGDAIALLGCNGSGKSCLLSLARGLEFPSHGEVLLDGYRIDRLNPAYLNSSIAFVSLSAPILKGSFRRALTLDIHPRPTDESLKKVVSHYGLEHFHDRIGGLDGKILEGGKNLSGGERIRISMIRAELKSPRLLIIDESILLLDKSGLTMVANSMRKLEATILVACDHPLITDACDTIWHLRNGDVEERRRIRRTPISNC